MLFLCRRSNENRQSKNMETWKRKKTDLDLISEQIQLVLIPPMANLVMDYIKNPPIIIVKNNGTYLFHIETESEWKSFIGCTPSIFGDLFEEDPSDLLKEWCFHLEADHLSDDKIRQIHIKRTQRCGWYNREAETRVRDLWENTKADRFYS